MSGLKSLILSFCLFSPHVAGDPGGLRKLQAEAPIFEIPIPSTDDGLLEALPGRISPDAATVGMWSGLESWPMVSIHSAVMPNGRVVTYGAPTGEAVQDGQEFLFWDPKLGFGPDAFSILPNAQAVDSFCSSGTLLSDGSYLTSGGAGQLSGARSVESSILNWEAGTVRRAEDLNSPRWYGTMTALPDGSALMTGGGEPYVTGGWSNPAGEASRVSSTPEVYTEGQGWRELSGAFSLDAFGAENNRYWYPRQWVTPFGTVFGISTDKMWEMRLEGTGSIRTIGDFKTRPEDATRPNVGPTSTAVMYDIGKILQVGGNGYANGFASRSSFAATTFDINNINNGIVRVEETEPMRFPRQWANSAVLLNGEVLVTGGTQFADTAGTNAVLQAEIWNPATGRWTLGPSAAVYRGYHSSVSLLPNGALFSTGGGVPGPVNNFNAEVYFPPHFFERRGTETVLAVRPRIISISRNALSYGDELQVQVSVGNNTVEVALLAVPTVTHSFDSNQRRLKLAFRTIAGGVEVTMPRPRSLAPPGYYYLTVVNDAGVPSEAVILGLGSAAPPLPGTPPAAPGTPPARPVTGIFGFLEELKDITGPFEVEAVARFDNLGGPAWQRIFDFGNGPAQDNILLGQREGTNDMILDLWIEGVMYRATAPGAIVAGEIATWNAGVDASGTMWIRKNGGLLVSTPGRVPENVRRFSKLIGESNWDADAPLEGAVLGIAITNQGGARDTSLLNVPQQIKGPFEVAVFARFDTLVRRAWQRIFDFGNGARRDNVFLGQCADTTDMCLEVWRGGAMYRARAAGAIVVGEVAAWRAGVTAAGRMWIEKGGERLIEVDGIVPENVFRSRNFVGRSNWILDDPIDGFVLGLQFTGLTVPTPTPPTPTPPTVPTEPTVGDIDLGSFRLDDVTGPFEVEAVARFDNLGGPAWQRIFDFGNGPTRDNVLLGQREGSNDMILDLWIGGIMYRATAPGAIVAGETSRWNAGVNADGTMWIRKNGGLLVSFPGRIPEPVARANKLIGESNWGADAPLEGAVLGIAITNQGEARDLRLLNIPLQIDGPCVVAAFARFDNLTGRAWQRIFDFGNGPTQDNVLLGQCGGTNDMCFDIWKAGVMYRVMASGAIVEGEVASWKARVNAAGIMRIEKNNILLVEAPGTVPADVNRGQNLVGASNWAADSPLDGMVFGLRVLNL